MYKFLLVFLCLCMVLLASCSSSNNPTTPVQTVMLFDTTAFPANEYFQVNGLPSLDGWKFHPSIPGDTITFDPFGPPANPTAWSITLRKSDVPPVTNNATKSFIHCTSGVYSFTVWLTMKKKLPDTTFNPVGFAAII